MTDNKTKPKWTEKKVKKCMKCGSPMAYIYVDENIRRYVCKENDCGQIEDMHIKGATLCPNNQKGVCTSKCCFDADGDWHWYYCGVKK